MVHNGNVYYLTIQAHLSLELHNSSMLFHHKTIALAILQQWWTGFEMA